MTTYYVATTGVNTDPGSSAAPWRDIKPSIAKLSPGDTLRVRSGTYYEAFSINKANVTVEVDSGHSVTLNGKYPPSLFNNSAGFQNHSGGPVAPGKLPGPTSYNIQHGDWVLLGSGEYSPLVQIAAIGVTFRGFTIRNVAGRGIAVNAVDNVVVEDCVIDFCYANNFQAENCDNLTIRNCKMTRGSAKWFAPNHPGALVDSCLFPKGCNGVLIDGVIMALGWGEGINCGWNTQNVEITNCTAHTMFHTVYYSDGGFRGMKFHNNVGYWCENAFAEIGTGSARHVFALVDEEGFWDVLGANVQIYNNIFVGGYQNAFHIAGGPFGVPGSNEGRAVWLNNAYIGGNTIVGSTQNGVGSGTYGDEVVDLGEPSAKPHSNALFENNIWIKHPSNPRPLMKCSTYATPVFRNNLRNTSIPASAQGTGDIQLASLNTPVLMNPFVTVSVNNFTRDMADIPDPLDTTFHYGNYMPLESSAVIGAASSGSPAGGVTPPLQAVNYDFLGNERDSDPDIGALEYNGSTPTPTVTAGFTRTPSASSIIEGTSVTFTNTSTVGGTSITSHLWTIQLGGVDQFVATTSDITYTFDEPGTWTITLRETTALGGFDEETQTLTVTAATGTSVTAVISRSPTATTVVAGTTITFTDSSILTNVSFVSRLWEVENSVPAVIATGSEPTLVYTFGTAGTFTVTLTETASGGLSDDASVVITVAAASTATVTASFTSSDADNAFPVNTSVTFTNTSSAGGGATIVGYIWNVVPPVGDSYSFTSTNLTFTFTSTGTWVVMLTVKTDLEITAVEAIEQTVWTNVASVGAADFMVVPKLFSVSTSSGAQTITATSLGTLVPKAVQFRMVGATVSGTSATGAFWCESASTDSARWALACHSANGADPTQAKRKFATNKVLISLDATGDTTGSASFTKFVPGGVELYISDAFPSAYLVEATFWAGDQLQIVAGVASLGATNATTTVPMSFQPDAIYLASSWAVNVEFSTPLDPTASFYRTNGWALASGGQRSMTLGDRDAQGTTAINNNTHATRIGLKYDWNPAEWATVNLSSISASGFSLKTESKDINRMAGYLALKAPYSFYLTQLDMGTGASWSIPLPFEAQTVIAFTSDFGGTNDGSAMGVYTYSANDSVSHSLNHASADAAATSATRSFAGTGVRLVNSAGSNLWNGTAALDADSLDITWSTAPAQAWDWTILAIQEGTTIGAADPGPAVAFETSDPKQGRVPLTIFFDSSSTNPNGATIIGYLWYFGDGGTSTEQKPWHTYTQAGTYDVTLQVTNANGTSTLTKEALIIAEPFEAGANDILIGASDPLSVTEMSENGIVGVTHSHKANLNWLPLNHAEDFVEGLMTTSVEQPEKAFLLWDNVNHKLVVVVDGTAWDVTLT